MGLPISVTTDRSWLIDLMKVKWIGPLVVFGICALPAVVSMAFFELVQAVSWLFHIHHRMTEDWAIALGLLAAVPWNLALYRRQIRIRLLWTPAWLFCLIMGAFGIVKASGVLR
jgi:hypothetical protein